MFGMSKSNKIANDIGETLHRSIINARTLNEETGSQRFISAFTAAYILEYTKLIFEKHGFDGVAETNKYIEGICGGIIDTGSLYTSILALEALSPSDREFYLSAYQHLNNTPEEYAEIDATVGEECKMLEFFLTGDLDWLEGERSNDDVPEESETEKDVVGATSEVLESIEDIFKSENIDIVLKYRPEIKKIFDELKDINQYNKIKILKKLDENPKISEKEFLQYIKDIISGNIGPFENQEYNKIFSKLFDYGADYQQKFVKIYQTLGETFNAGVVLEEISRDYQKKLDEKKIKEEKEQEKDQIKFDISNKIILNTLPFNEYETSSDILTIRSFGISRRSKKDNFFHQDYIDVDHLDQSLKYKLQDNLFLNGFQVNFLTYKGYLIMEIRAGVVYLAKYETHRLFRASLSNQHATFQEAKQWIDEYDA